MQFKDLTDADPGKRRVWNFIAFIFMAVFGLTGPVFPLWADFTLTQLANEGVLISEGETRILIDAMVVEPYSVYGGLPPDVLPLFEQLSGPFSGIDLVLASHRHHDHNQPRFACRFLQSSTGTRFFSSAQVIGLMREKCRTFMTSSPRIIEISPQYGQPHVIEMEGARVTIFLLSHGKRKYARIQNYGHLVEIGGLTVLHVGDAAMDPLDFARAGLDTKEIDVALIPFWYFQPGSPSELMTRFLDVPNRVAVHIPPGEMDEVRAYMSEDFPRVIILQNTLDQAQFTKASRPQP